MRLEALLRSSPPEELVAAVPRHLAHWPRFLALAVDSLGRSEAGLRDLVSILEAEALGAADRIDLGVRGSRLPSFAPFVTASLELFTSRDMITGYIAKVAFILARLPEVSPARRVDG